MAVLLARKHSVKAVDIVPEKVEMINRRLSPIQDEYIEKFFAEEVLDLTATLDAEDAYCIIFRADSGDKMALIFNATEKALEMIRYYNRTCFSLQEETEK